MFKVMNNKKGFTLVELMIVVVIMAILVAVAVPIYSAVTTNAQNKTCASNARIIAAQVNQILMGTIDGSPSVATVVGGAVTLGGTTTVGDINGGGSTKVFADLLQEGLPVCPFNEGNTYEIAANGAVSCSGWTATATLEKPEHTAA